MTRNRRVLQGGVVVGLTMVGLLFASNGCSTDPPNQGQLVIDVDRTAVRPSFAAPMVAGTAALLLAHKPRLLRGHPCEIIDQILRNADRVEALAGTLRYGGRRLDVLHALTDTPSEPSVRVCQ